MKVLLQLVCLFAPAALCSQITIPPGTILPITLKQTIKAGESRPGTVVRARLMQDVPLPGHAKISQGAILSGTVVNASKNSRQITIRFSSLEEHGVSISVLTALRAHASYMAVSEAQVPPMSIDRNSTYSSATLVLIGGDISYRGGGPVTHGNNPVGKPVGDGVLARVLPNPDRGCDLPIDTNNTEQALWLFSSDACGIYGYIHRSVVDRGIQNSSGQFTVATSSGKMKLQEGDGLLLVVISAAR